MDKSDLMRKTYENYMLLTETQKNNFSKVSNRLLAINYICGGRKKDYTDYDFIVSNSELFQTFFALLDYNLYIKRGDQVAYIVNENSYNHLNLNQLYSVVLLLLRKMYFQKSQEFQDSEFVYITLGELHSEVEATGLYEKRITKTELRTLYSFLSKYNICERIGELDEDESRLIIYPTINYVLSVSKIEEIADKLKQYNRKDEGNEEINESQID